MGCFDAADGISGLTIKNGDKCGLVLLTPESSYPHKVEDGKTILKPCTSLPGGGPDETFAPYCLPIWGEYNDYGSLEKIVRDSTVLGLEKHFDTTIEKILGIIQSGRDIFDSYSGVMAAYGTGLTIPTNKKPSTKWLEKAGFRKPKDDEIKLMDRYFGKKDVWLLPGTSIKEIWDEKDEKWIDTGEPTVWFEFDREAIWSGRTELVPLYRTHKWHGTTHKDADGEYKMTYDHDIVNFCKDVIKNTQSGWFGYDGNDTGIILGVKEKHWKQLMELKTLSGMFIDKTLYDAVTDFNKERDDLLDDTYPNKHMMPLLGFKYEKMVSGTDHKKEIVDDGMPLPSRSEKPNLLVYTHEIAPDYYFAVDNCDDNMNVDLYDKNMKDLNCCEGMFGEQYSVSTFSPIGIQMLLSILTGSRIKKTDDWPKEREGGIMIEIDHLLNLPDNYFEFAKMKDYMSRRNASNAEIIKWNKKNEYIRHLSDDEKKKLNDGRTAEENEYFMSMVRKSIRMDRCSRDDRHRLEYSIGFYAKFPHVFEFYSKDMIKQTPKFIENTNRWRRFRRIMWKANKIFMPAAHHGQHGEYDGQIQLANTIMNVAVKKQMQREEEYDEENEKEEVIPMPIHIEGENIKVYMRDGILHVEQKKKAKS